jgi:hypothetical protein
MLTRLLATQMRVIVNTAVATFHNTDTVCVTGLRAVLELAPL